VEINIPGAHYAAKDVTAPILEDYEFGGDFLAASRHGPLSTLCTTRVNDGFLWWCNQCAIQAAGLWL
jgi:hypothetical protein